MNYESHFWDCKRTISFSLWIRKRSRSPLRKKTNENQEDAFIDWNNQIPSFSFILYLQNLLQETQGVNFGEKKLKERLSK